MKPAPFDYVRPSSVAEACRILADAGGGATLLAGGQTLMPLLNLRMNQPFILIDLGGIAELATITQADEGVAVGAMVRQADALNNSLLAQKLPAFIRALRHVGHHQTRNRGTIGGSVALGEPAAEMPATAVALGAQIDVTSPHGSRRIAARDFYLGPYMTALADNEIITRIIYPDWPAGHRVLFREVAQRPGDFALIGLVGAVVLDGRQITRAGLAWFGMGPTPLAMERAEQLLTGANLDDLDLDAIANEAIAETAPFDDQQTSSEYRRTVGRRVFARALKETFAVQEAV